MVRFLYIVAMHFVAVGVVVAIVVGFVNDAGSGLLALVIAPLLGLVYLMITRLYLELIVILFKTRDAVEEVAGNIRV